MINNSELRKNRCCFTGHRPEKLHISEQAAKELLKTAIKQAIKDGFKTFISGMARGIDMWAAEIVIEDYAFNDEIKLICTSPYEGFENRWSTVEKERYQNILKKADYVKYVCEHYSKQCFQIRNMYMVDCSTRVIAAYNGERGGTYNTIKYATSKNIKVVNILQ